MASTFVPACNSPRTAVRLNSCQSLPSTSTRATVEVEFHDGLAGALALATS